MTDEQIAEARRLLDIAGLATWANGGKSGAKDEYEQDLIKHLQLAIAALEVARDGAAVWVSVEERLPAPGKFMVKLKDPLLDWQTAVRLADRVGWRLVNVQKSGIIYDEEGIIAHWLDLRQTPMPGGVE